MNAFLDGALTPSDESRLDRLLEARRETADLFRSVVDIHCLLRSRYARAEDVADVSAAIDKHDTRNMLVRVMQAIDEKRGPEPPDPHSRRDRPVRRRRSRSDSAGRRGAARSRTTAGSRSWFRWMAVAACLAIITGALVYNHRRSTQFAEVLVARIKATAPGVMVDRAGGEIEAVVDMGILRGDRIRTGIGRKAAFVYENEDAEITIDENTTLDVGGFEKGKRLKVRVGKISCTVSPQPGDEPMIISTPHARAEVKGTIFSLAVDTGLTRIDVVEGLVALTRISDGSTIEVAGGQYAVASDGIELKALPIEEPASPAPAEVSEPAGRPPRSDGHHVEEKVVLEEDFEQGLEKWFIAVQNPEDPGIMQSARGPERDAVRIVEVERNGATTRVLELDGTAAAIAGRLVGLSPRDRSIGLEHVVEYDAYFVPQKGFAPIRGDGTRIPSGRWVHFHTVSRVVARDGVREQVRTELVSGRGTRVFRDPYSEGRPMQITCRAMLMRIDNIVIRKAVPGGNGDGQEREVEK
jgi:hypothetical protein